jgi:hypothetical protein
MPSPKLLDGLTFMTEVNKILLAETRTVGDGILTPDEMTEMQEAYDDGETAQEFGWRLVQRDLWNQQRAAIRARNADNASTAEIHDRDAMREAGRIR